MLTFPSIDPIAFSIGPLQVHWYGIMYLIGFTSAWLLAHWRTKHYKLEWTSEQISDLIFYAALGVIMGGRVGYMLFYDFSTLVHDPLSLFKIWQGGMSFHGGLLGVVVAVWIFAYKKSKSFWDVGDFIAPLVPIGLGAGRIGNFINGELWGRTTDMPWGMIYSHVDSQPRHPSELYEFGLEGICLFLLVWIYARIPRPTGRVSAVFLVGYAICRIIAEFFRQPDPQLGFIAFGWLTMGQILSIPMLVLGIWLGWIKR